jgi:hypothetical protein
VTAHKAPLSGNIVRKRKSKSTGGNNQRTYSIVGQSVANNGPMCSDDIPVTWLQEIAGKEITSLPPTKKARWFQNNVPFAVSKKQLRSFKTAENSNGSADVRDTPVDTSRNYVIQVNFAAEGNDDRLGFRIVNSIQHQRGSFSDPLIVPCILSVHPGSCAARAGLRHGMRILAIGMTTIKPARRMPQRNSIDYSPAHHVMILVSEALQRSRILNFRVDKD